MNEREGNALGAQKSEIEVYFDKKNQGDKGEKGPTNGT